MRIVILVVVLAVFLFSGLYISCVGGIQDDHARLSKNVPDLPIMIESDDDIEEVDDYTVQEEVLEQLAQECIDSISAYKNELENLNATKDRVGIPEFEQQEDIDWLEFKIRQLEERC